MRNSRLTGNYALEKGGGLYLACPSPYNCELYMRDWNNFTENTADESGGAIYWEDVEPKLSNN